MQFQKHRNLVPLISLEGYEQNTDDRRVKGVFQLLQQTIQRLKQLEVFFGVSLTVTRNHFDTLIDSAFIDIITGWGGKLIFAEYSSIKENCDSNVWQQNYQGKDVAYNEIQIIIIHWISNRI